MPSCELPARRITASGKVDGDNDDADGLEDPPSESGLGLTIGYNPLDVYDTQAMEKSI